MKQRRIIELQHAATLVERFGSLMTSSRKIYPLPPVKVVTVLVVAPCRKSLSQSSQHALRP